MNGKPWIAGAVLNGQTKDMCSFRKEKNARVNKSIVQHGAWESVVPHTPGGPVLVLGLALRLGVESVDGTADALQRVDDLFIPTLSAFHVLAAAEGHVVDGERTS